MMKWRVGLGILIVGLSLAIVGGVRATGVGAKAQISEVGSISITNAPSQINKEETFTVNFRVDLNSSLHEGTYTIKMYVRNTNIVKEKNVRIYTSDPTGSISATYSGDYDGQSTLRLTGHKFGDSSKVLTPDETTVTLGNPGDGGPTLYTLDVSSESGGYTNPSEGTHTYEAGETVVAVATPNSGYMFAGWTGDVTKPDDTIKITMDSDKSIKATFEKEPTKYSLSVSPDPSDAGRVDPSSGTYVEGENATVEAFPAEGWKFDYWSGNTSGTSNPITVVMDSDKSITANFRKLASGYFTLNGIQLSEGSSATMGKDSASLSFTVTSSKSPKEVWYTLEGPNGGTIGDKSSTIRTSPPFEWVLPFEESGDYGLKGYYANDNGRVKAVDATVHRSVGMVTLTVVQSPPEGGTVSMVQANEFTYKKGEVAKIQAQPEPGFRFSHWSGDLPEKKTGRQLSITMTEDKTVTANFKRAFMSKLAKFSTSVNGAMVIIGSLLSLAGAVIILRRKM